MKNKLLFSTNNAHKVLEAKNILTSYEVISLKDKGFNLEEPIENGSSYRENALIKTKYYYSLYKCPCFSDDSGLEVVALDNKPGIHSKRFYNGNDLDNTNFLLKSLENIKERDASYECVICYTDDGINYHYFSGSLKGTISHFIRGNNGFGYDPIFIPNNYDISLGELSEEVKNTISHRYHALNSFLKYLNENNSSF